MPLFSMLRSLSGGYALAYTQAWMSPCKFGNAGNSDTGFLPRTAVRLFSEESPTRTRSALRQRDCRAGALPGEAGTDARPLRSRHYGDCASKLPHSLAHPGETHAENGLAQNDARVYKESCRKVGIRSMIVVPLHHDGEPVGVFGAYSGNCNAFDDADVAILELVGRLIAASMFHASRNEVGVLFHRATHDPLTGLANCSLFLDRLRHCQERASRERTKFGVVVLDMDGMKQINDRWGHRAGDAALRELARRLQHHSRSSDTLARLGGDEFAVILSRVSDRADLVAEARRASHELEPAFAFAGKVLKLSASIGGALYPDDADEINALLDKADQAMYEQKRIKRKPRRAEEPALGSGQPGGQQRPALF